MGGCLLATIVVSLIAIIRATRFADRVSVDERVTCMVQARGLPASRHLAATIGDIADLISASTIQADRKRGVPAPVIHVLEDLHSQASAYSALVGQQPATRHC